MSPTIRQGVLLCAALSVCVVLAVPGTFPGLGGPARITLAVFTLATCAWIGTRVDETYVALGAALALTATGVISSDDLFGTLGDSTVWLLICAFVLAAAVSRTGLAGRAAAFLVSGARSVRQLVHLTTAALVVTAFAVPATSGRAALALPVFLALAKVLADRKRLVVMLSLLFPAVILLSAVATLIGAGAHLITVSVLWEGSGQRIGFTEWLLLGLPLAVVSSHLAAEAVLLTTTRREDRRGPVAVTAEQIQEHSDKPVTGPLAPAEARCALLMFTVVLLWCSEPLHGVPPAVTALIGAVVASSPALGTVRLKEALGTVPWPLLLFMAATMAMGIALADSGAAAWLVSGLPGGGAAPPWLFLAVVIAVSTAAHLVLQSRSARSSVLVPLVVAAAATAGVNPVAAALASTAAAGFCHTLPASAKPVTLFAGISGTPTFQPRDLLRLSAVLAPVTAAVVLLFALAVWPLLGVPVLSPVSP
ncbi:SLC13 family permease [Streptomyces lycii]|uniref:SLC13 family permease n=1 Tax=Streptomyces lycii TaxID=2654337 RepID=A0ABQ7FIG9_9ACTN|nr:SLC13 family permease [Streptomyces lycii]KAF4408460.1 SLC13 family permease [Streptomyces lycii]